LLPLALRCRANLAAGFSGDAVAACTKLVEHRAVHLTRILYTLAHRDLAEAWRRLGDARRAEAAERRFDELWIGGKPTSSGTH